MSDSDYEDLESGHAAVQRSGSSQGFDSDCNAESDNETFDRLAERIESHDHTDGTTTPQEMSSSGSQFRKNLQRSQSLAVNHTPSREMEGLKGGARTWNVEPGNGARAGPQLPLMKEEAGEVDGGTLPPRAKALVKERVSEHRERILRYFQQVTHNNTHFQYQHPWNEKNKNLFQMGI